MTGKSYYTRSGSEGNYVYTFVSSPKVAQIESYYEVYTESLENHSAIGFTAILRKGEKISPQSNRMFINGVEETQDYAFNGDSDDSFEYVNVWYFSNNGVLSYIVKHGIPLRFYTIGRKEDSSVINIDWTLMNYSEELITMDLAPQNPNIRKIIIKKQR